LRLQAHRRRADVRRIAQKRLTSQPRRSILPSRHSLRLIRTVAFVTVAGLLASSCGLFGDSTVYRCPAVFILDDAKDLTRFKAGPGRDITDILFEAEIVNFTGECDYGDGEVEIELLVQIRVERGPANKNREIKFDYFAAIPKFKGQAEGKRVLPVIGEFEGTRTRLVYQDELKMVIPVAKPTDGGAIEIVLGFQLTPAELKFNRSRKQR
jgi:hypothetical protein